MRARKPNPLHVIVNDLKALTELAIQGSIHAPEFHQEMIKKKARKILSRYVVTRKRVNREMRKAGL